MLRQVEQGDTVQVTVNGVAVAQIVPARGSRPFSLSRGEFARLLHDHQADPALTEDLRVLAGDTTDDLDPLA